MPSVSGHCRDPVRPETVRPQIQLCGARLAFVCLPDDLACALVFPDAEKHGLTQPIIPSPLRELHLTNHRRFNPNRAFTSEGLCPCPFV
jgi:hypothetical protein